MVGKLKNLGAQGWGEGLKKEREGGDVTCLLYGRFLCKCLPGV